MANVLTARSISFFFFKDAAPSEIYTLSLHDALPIWNTMPSQVPALSWSLGPVPPLITPKPTARHPSTDRKSTRLNSSHTVISYAVFCLKKKTTKAHRPPAERPVPQAAPHALRASAGH